MFYSNKTFDIEVSHNLNLDYESKHTNLHGHSLSITIYMRATDGYVEENDLVVDFSIIEKRVIQLLDHQYLNNVLTDTNPTLENLAIWIVTKIQKLFESAVCYKVDIVQGTDRVVTYELD